MKKICMGCSVHKVSYSKTQEIFLGLPACLIFLIICFICHVLPVLDFVWFDIGGFVRSPSTNVSFFFCQIWKFRFLIILSLFLILVLSIPSNLVISLSLSLKNCCEFIWVTNFMSDFSEIDNIFHDKLYHCCNSSSKLHFLVLMCHNKTWEFLSLHTFSEISTFRCWNLFRLFYISLQQPFLIWLISVFIRIKHVKYCSLYI